MRKMTKIIILLKVTVLFHILYMTNYQYSYISDTKKNMLNSFMANYNLLLYLHIHTFVCDLRYSKQKKFSFFPPQFHVEPYYNYIFFQRKEGYSIWLLGAMITRECFIVLTFLMYLTPVVASWCASPFLTRNNYT